MDEDIARKIGLFRHQIISPVLMDSGRSQMSYFKKLEKREFDIPGIGAKKFKASTMKNWLNLYRKFGFEALVPKFRRDKGMNRKCGHFEKIKELRNYHLNLPITIFYEKCLQEELLGHPPIHYSTLVRFLKKESLIKKRESRPRKKYEMERFGELWVADFCHGPRVRDGRRKRKAIVLAIIDDYSRYIVGAKFAFAESTVEIEQVFKEAILSFGLPDRLYVDNGPSFSSKYLAHACAQMQIGLIHSKPYDSPSRGKIERFFRTVRDRFLSQYDGSELFLGDLNDAFQKWLREDYLFKKHSSIKLRPIDRYKNSTEKYPLKRVSREELDELFMASFTREVRKDSTVSIDTIFYEVPNIYIGMKVEIRYIQSNHPEYFLYENNKKICKLLPVDSKANAKSYRRSPRENILNFHQENE